jgi:hypothetical protein
MALSFLLDDIGVIVRSLLNRKLQIVSGVTSGPPMADSDCRLFKPLSERVCAGVQNLRSKNR